MYWMLRSTPFLLGALDASLRHPDIPEARQWAEEIKSELRTRKVQWNYFH